MESSSVDLVGKVTGIIRPPPEVRVVVDKTAQFVARNGKSFEERIQGSEEGKTAKFHFLRSYHPFHAYYVKRIKDFEEGRDEDDRDDYGTDDAIAAEQDQDRASHEKPDEDALDIDMREEIGSSSTSRLSALMNPLARFANIDIARAPPGFEFCLTQSFGLTAEDADIIKLTARYAAANGSDFVAKLAEKELGNPKFDFLNPSHTLFSSFSRLVDMYRRIIKGAPDLKVAIESKKDAEVVLKSAVHRWSWACAREVSERKRSSKGGDASAEPIDWADFAVVETITFGEDELVGTSTSIGAVAAAQEPTGPAHAREPSNLGGVDASGYNGDNGGAIGATSGHSVEAEEDLHVVSDYQPRLAGTGSEGAPQRTMVDPISGKAVPVEHMSEHLKVQLADPRGRVEHQRFVEKQRETGIAAGDSMVSSLMQFAEKRKDIFGGETQPQVQPQAQAHAQAQAQGAPPAGAAASNKPRSGLRAVVQAPPQIPPAPGMPMYPPYGAAPFPPVTMAAPPGAHPGAPRPMGGRPVNNTPAWMAQQQQQQQQQQQCIPPPPPPSAMAPVPAVPAAEGPDLKRPRVEAPSSPSTAAPAPAPAPAPASAPVPVPGPTIRLQVQCADDNGGGSYNLHGQTVTVGSVDTTATVKALKGQISAALDMPANKINLRLPSAGPKEFIRDATVVGTSGLGEGSTVLLSARVRGGR